MNIGKARNTCNDSKREIRLTNSCSQGKFKRLIYNEGIILSATHNKINANVEIDWILIKTEYE